MEKEIVKFYLSIDGDDAEERTCAKFGISEQTLEIILMTDLMESMTD